MKLIVSETIFGLYPEYSGSVGVPLEATSSRYDRRNAEHSEVVLVDTTGIRFVPIMYTLPYTPHWLSEVIKNEKITN